MVSTIDIKQGEFPGKGDVLIYPVFSDSYKKDKNLTLLDKNTAGLLSAKIKTHDFTGKDDELVSLEYNGFYKHIIIVGLGKEKDCTPVVVRNAYAQAFLKAQTLKHPTVSTYLPEKLYKDQFEIGKNISLAFYLVNYSFDVFKSIEARKKIHKIKELNIQFPISLPADATRQALQAGNIQNGIKYGKILAQGIELTRNLVNLPGSHLNPATLVEEAYKLEKQSRGKISVSVLDEDECQKLGMGAFLGVAQGSEQKPKLIVLHYKGKGKKICLIGKSITFDSGGLSLKPSGSMETMKCDMAGGATVLGVFSVLNRLSSVETRHAASLPDIYGILPACENMPSGRAIRPGDVVTAMNKKTVEVVNTDAEGRLTLADALVYAEEKIKPDYIIDLATLTGACMVALGTEITGMFGNDEKFNDEFASTAKKEGDELWPLPLYKVYSKLLRSDIADLKNVTGKGYGGAITAALFLSEFIKKTKWIHLDIAGPAYSEAGQNGIISKGGTGWGILSLVELILNFKF